MSMEHAIETLKGVHSRVSVNSSNASNRIAAKIIRAQHAVRARYQPLFSRERVGELQADGFLGFLLFDNNQHWSNLQRQGSRMTADMPRLREALALLVDEELPLRTRLNQLRPKGGKPVVKGLARSVMTAILQIVYPDRYGVLNNTVEAGMRQVGIWPDSPRGASLADRYEAVNRVLHTLAEALRIDLWTLDALWYRLTLRGSPRFDDEEPSSVQERSQAVAVMKSQFQHRGESSDSDWNELSLLLPVEEDRRTSSPKTLARMRTRVAQLSAEFDRYVTAFNHEALFTGPSLYFHLKTVEIRARHASVAATISDSQFFEYLYATLTAWGMHRPGRSRAKLANLHEMRESFEGQATAIDEMASLRLRDLSTIHAQQIASKLWAIMERLQVSTSNTRIVACSKALHHLLPLLMPPIDREYTLSFFYRRKTMNRGDKATFLEIFPLFREIAVAQGDRLAQLVGPGMNTSETKVIDNAIIGFVSTHSRK
ncbi:MAG: hypothetical protein JXA69_00375 [Phycisphaerae bacterium]|nr:hypothetical protein [Phycisphaerae bacterium]